MKYKESDLTSWSKHLDNLLNPKSEITIWIIWKYTQFKDAYLSLIEAISHAWANNKVKVNLNWIESDTLENDESQNYLKAMHRESKLDWIIIPWWFWSRWVEWKINAVKFARENNIPFLWICLWLQVAVIEFARNVCNIKWAYSTEFDELCEEPVIDYIPEQREVTEKWWTMRLWEYKAILKKWTKTYNLYWTTEIFERHRHRYEVNFEYHEILEKNWLLISWISPNKTLAEFIEIPAHKYFVATQAHPEFKSRLNQVHPLFDGLIKACLN
jgi:CTP synthase